MVELASWSSKISALLRLVLRITGTADAYPQPEPHQHPPEQTKILVFSLYPEVLRNAALALGLNGIRCVNAAAGSGSNARRFQTICEFQYSNSSDDPGEEEEEEAQVGMPQVLLLPIKSAANGLNLTQATHVVLLEPLLQTAEEEQAIGRVHRIGQSRRTWVHRFVVRGTVEEEIWVSRRGPANDNWQEAIAELI